VQTFTTFAGKSDITIAEDIIDELIHRGLLEFASGVRSAAESGGALDFLGQEVADICTQSGKDSGGKQCQTHQRCRLRRK
jgi:hypothetical protein